MSLIYRMSNENDVDALVSFWKENSGWDAIDRNEWERRFIHTPFGPSLVAMALDENSGAIQGQIVFIQTQINVDKEVVHACRPFALVIHKNLRSSFKFISLLQIISKTYDCAIKCFKEKGIRLIHMMPDPGWVRAFKFLPDAQVSSYPLWSLPLALKNKFDIPDDYKIQILNSDNEQINALWMKNKELYGCCLIRNTKTISWKISHGNYRLLGVFKQGELIGLSTSQIKLKDKQWLICDVMASDFNNSFDLTLKATCNFINDYVIENEIPITKAALLVTPMFKEKIESIGFKIDNYNFPVVVQILDKSISKKQVSPDRWYVSAND